MTRVHVWASAERQGSMGYTSDMAFYQLSKPHDMRISAAAGSLVRAHLTNDAP